MGFFIFQLETVSGQDLETVSVSSWRRSASAAGDGQRQRLETVSGQDLQTVSVSDWRRSASGAADGQRSRTGDGQRSGSGAGLRLNLFWRRSAVRTCRRSASAAGDGQRSGPADGQQLVACDQNVRTHVNTRIQRYSRRIRRSAG